MTAQRARQLDRVAAATKAGHDRSIGSPVAALGAHDLASHEVDDGNEDHAGSEDWRLGIAAVALSEYLSGSGTMQPRLGTAHG